MDKRPLARYDGWRVFKFIIASRYYKDLKLADEAAMASIRAVLPDIADLLEPKISKFPHYKAMYYARLQLDMVAMLLRRRQVQTTRTEDTVHLFAGCSR